MNKTRQRMIRINLAVLASALIIVSYDLSADLQAQISALPEGNFEVMLAPIVADKRYGAPTLVELKNGVILAAYNEWTMPGENSDFSPAHIAARKSEDGGRSWGRPVVLQENTSVLGRMGPPSLNRLQNGEIGFAYAELISHSNFTFFYKKSRDEGQTWSRPVRITQAAKYYVMNNHRVIQLKSGRLLAPLSFVPDVSKRQQYSWEVVCFYSDDHGESWKEGGGVVKMPKFNVGAQEPGLVELKDGSVLMIVRNAQERVYKAHSKDGGVTWTEPEPIEQLMAPISPATIMRIPTTGDLAIVWNYSPKMRTPLAIAVSTDEGKTWGKIKILEAGYFSYAYAAFLFPQNANRLVLCYWVDETLDRPHRGIGLKIRSLGVDWLYSEINTPVIR